MQCIVIHSACFDSEDTSQPVQKKEPRYWKHYHNSFAQIDFIENYIGSTYYELKKGVDAPNFWVPPYLLLSERDVLHMTVKESMWPREKISTQTHEAMRPACPTSSAQALATQFIVFLLRTLPHAHPCQRRKNEMPCYDVGV